MPSLYSIEHLSSGVHASKRRMEFIPTSFQASLKEASDAGLASSDEDSHAAEVVGLQAHVRTTLDVVVHLPSANEAHHYHAACNNASNRENDE